ncbi:putative RNA-directed DNA polymerase from transposon X-element [Trichonephila inaurata madagascariensis]|uniref:Putative RNA-directed DNA polymerase from transposon X-element n=1 Tax=Trichonephila inaurata madagascariensis TaxID=2747483 RepID=A0A8X6WYW6_9ARAC|nr:putative RNA-directed DNA polymerase from transposon X-element [Trichonephila inaurata madagascariensis]
MKNASGRIKVDLSELYDLLESKLMALESLGRTKEKFAEFHQPLVESCLPETVLRTWERSRSVVDSSPQDSACSLDKLLCFLRNDVQSEELAHLETKELDIELLLGADVIVNILTGNSLKLSSGVTVVQTKFGYTVIGKTNTIYNNLCINVVSLHCANFTVTDLWNLDAIGITDLTVDAKRKHAHSEFLNQIKENLSVLPDGRYELPLPFKFETQLPNNKSATIKRNVSKN